MEIIGHHKERAALAKLEKAGRIGQSYLFSGPESIGKSLVAFDFACRLVGQPNFQPSENQGTPLDVRMLEPETLVKRGVAKKKRISTKEVREALRFLQETPFQGSYRVLIVCDAHLLSPGAQNALLKFVEEPEPTAVMVFVTHESGQLLETLRSRLLALRFDFVSEAILKEEGAAFGLAASSEVPEFFFSLGRPGILLRAKENPKAFQAKKDALGKLFRVSTLSVAERLRLAESLAADVPTLVQLLEWFLPGIHAQTRKERDAGKLSRYFLLLEKVTEALHCLKKPEYNARLVFENLLLAL